MRQVVRLCIVSYFGKLVIRNAWDNWWSSKRERNGFQYNDKINVSSKELLWINGWDQRRVSRDYVSKGLAWVRKPIMIRSKDSKRQGEFHIDGCHLLKKKNSLWIKMDFIVELNVIQAYVKLYMMQGWRVGIREWVSRN